MPYKDPETRREHDIKYRMKLGLKLRVFHDFETHRELAITSGINDAREWKECYKLGLFPDGIYSNPDQAFGRK